MMYIIGVVIVLLVIIVIVVNIVINIAIDCSVFVAIVMVIVVIIVTPQGIWPDELSFIIGMRSDWNNMLHLAGRRCCHEVDRTLQHIVSRGWVL
jgi:hypothetical protein